MDTVNGLCFLPTRHSLRDANLGRELAQICFLIFRTSFRDIIISVLIFRVCATTEKPWVGLALLTTNSMGKITLCVLTFSVPVCLGIRNENGQPVLLQRRLWVVFCVDVLIGRLFCCAIYAFLPLFVFFAFLFLGVWQVRGAVCPDHV